MLQRSHQTVALGAAVMLSAGCAGLTAQHAQQPSRDLLHARIGYSPAEQSADPTPVTGSLDVAEAIRLALSNHPRVRQAWAKLGLSQADLDEARRIGNPTFAFTRLNSGAGRQLTRSWSLDLGELLLWPARKRFAAAGLRRTQQEIAAELLALAAEVETGWFEAVSAQQVATMRDVVAKASDLSAELAQRYFDAGNITRLQLEQEYAAATQSRIAAVRAGAVAQTARVKLAGLVGLRADQDWRPLDRLPAPPAVTLSADGLVELALQQRLDLAAARIGISQREDDLGVSRRWRWIGLVEVGYERESETDGGHLRGPTLALQLPIFNQGQSAVTRATAELQNARAELDGLLLGVHNEVQLGLEQLKLSRDISERYRTALLPRREAIVARSQEQVNFMLKGVFELLLAKQEQYDAYQEYLEAVRDYWLARAELRRLVGGRLPDDELDLDNTIGPEAVLPDTAPEMDHSMHMQHGEQP